MIDLAGFPSAVAQSDQMVPGDIFAAKRIGIENWRERFRSPIPDSVFAELGAGHLRLFDECYSALDSARDRALLLGDFSFFSFLLLHLHMRAMEAVCDSAGAELVTGKLSESLLHPDFEALSAAHAPRGLREHSLRYEGRRLLKRLVFNEGPPRSRVSSLLRPGSVWSLGSWSRLKKDYAGMRGWRCDHHYAQTILRGGRMVDPGISRSLIEGIRGLAAAAARRFRERFGCSVDEAGLATCWLARLKDLGRIYETCASGRAPEALLLSEVAKPVQKTIASGLRQAGARVIGFHHGNDMGNAWEPLSPYLEYAHCDEFVCPTPASARFHALEHERSGISGMCPVEFASADTKVYAELCEAAAGSPAGEEVRSIMLMGYPMNVSRYFGYPGDWFYYQLDLELRLAEELRSCGFKVIYKMHPERRDEAEGVFDSVCNDILVEPFEEVWREGDAYMFGCVSSTTFGYALCLNRPVVVLDIKNTPWNQEAYSLLKKRCEMVPAWFDNNDRIQYDSNILKKAFESPRLPLDMSYVYQIMFPSSKTNISSRSTSI